MPEQIEVSGSCGRHEGHTLSRAGRCVYCSCGFRYQGVLPTDEDRAECREIYAGIQAGGDDAAGT